METPRLIIADEPTTALDVTVQRKILDLPLRINREEETAILLISHDISVIANVCERAIVMYGGLIVEDLPTASLLSAAHPYARALIASVPDMETDRFALIAEILSLLAGRTPARREQPLEPVSDSEMRVLRYLPTNLTAPEIARELHVARNTVKTQVSTLSSAPTAAPTPSPTRVPSACSHPPRPGRARPGRRADSAPALPTAGGTSTPPGATA